MSQTSILPSSEQAGESGQMAPHAQDNVSMVVSPVTGESSPASKVPSADEIVEQLLTHYPDADAAMVRRAYDYASAAHAADYPEIVGKGPGLPSIKRRSPAPHRPLFKAEPQINLPVQTNFGIQRFVVEHGAVHIPVI